MAALLSAALQAGIEVEFVCSVIQRRHLRPESPDIDQWPWPVRLYVLGRFSVVINGEPLTFSGKAQKKPLALLQALIALGGRDVDETLLAELLARDDEGATLQPLGMTLLRLRKLLGHADAVTLSRGKMSLNPDLCWVDAWTFERSLNAPPQECADQAALEQTLALYCGQFLAREAAQPWMLTVRERLHTKYLRALLALGRWWEDEQQWGSAAHCYQRGLETDPLTEELYRRLMICHERQGEPAEGMKVYQSCKRMLSMLLGVIPSAETEAVRERLMRGS